jgi:DNA polymerase-3 subunit epsilon
VSDLRFLACDGEMSSLDPGAGELLSLAWVPVERGEVILGGAVERRLRNVASVGQSATVHGLRDCDLRDGEAVAEVLESLLDAARGRILVFHHAALDIAFLEAAARRLWGMPLLLPVLDTLTLEERLLRRRGAVIAGGDLTLTACRARYGLPAHRAHTALGDALAGAELLLAQLARRGPDLRLGDLL